MSIYAFIGWLKCEKNIDVFSEFAEFGRCSWNEKMDELGAESVTCEAENSRMRQVIDDVQKLGEYDYADAYHLRDDLLAIVEKFKEIK